jgi:hypothetical protein
MPNKISQEDRAVAEQVRSLGSLPHAQPLPDPEVLWMRAQILAREETELAALRDATLARTLRYGVAAAGGAWLLAEAVGLAAWLQSTASTASVATATLAAFGAALLLGGLVLGRSFVAQRLRDLGLL